jgi:hypothetical protein
VAVASVETSFKTTSTATFGLRLAADRGVKRYYVYEAWNRLVAVRAANEEGEPGDPGDGMCDMEST